LIDRFSKSTALVPGSSGAFARGTLKRDIEADQASLGDLRTALGELVGAF
jgi:hypothetical protein